MRLTDKDYLCRIMPAGVHLPVKLPNWETNPIERGRAMRAQWHGRHRAAYWRALGNPNLKRAWRVRALMFAGMSHDEALAQARLDIPNV